MEETKQKVGDIRKKEILDAAKRVFLRKGYTDTVMEDIITETSLSRGGVYHHYKNKVEILHDLMREGIAYRAGMIREFLTDYSGELDDTVAAKMIVDKALDKSDLMSIYALYLQAQQNNKVLKDLFPVLVAESESSLRAGMKAEHEGTGGYITNEFLIFLINTIILGCEIMDGARESFIRNREYLEEAVKLFIRYHKTGRIK